MPTLNAPSNKPLLGLDRKLFEDAIHRLTDENKAESFFAFEDQLIEEIIEICKSYPPEVARKCVLRIRQVVHEEIIAARYVEPYLKSLRLSVDGAVSAVLKFL